jgi:hypothetical protein
LVARSACREVSCLRSERASLCCLTKRVRLSNTLIYLPSVESCIVSVSDVWLPPGGWFMRCKPPFGMMSRLSRDPVALDRSSRPKVYTRV